MILEIIVGLQFVGMAVLLSGYLSTQKQVHDLRKDTMRDCRQVEMNIKLSSSAILNEQKKDMLALIKSNNLARERLEYRVGILEEALYKKDDEDDESTSNLGLTAEVLEMISGVHPDLKKE